MKEYEFVQRQSLPYEAKIAHAERIAFEFQDWAIEHDKNLCVSIGGLDSLTLYKFLMKLGIEVTPVTVSALEDVTVRKAHKNIPGMVFLKPYMNKRAVIEQFGFPVISKEKAGKIELLQNPTEKNKTVRHAIVTGECGELGKFKTIKTGSRMLEEFISYCSSFRDILTTLNSEMEDGKKIMLDESWWNEEYAPLIGSARKKENIIVEE